MPHDPGRGHAPTADHEVREGHHPARLTRSPARQLGWYKMNDRMAQLPDHVGLLLLGEDETFLGSTFPISQPDKLYLGAGHTIPADRQDELRIAIHDPSGRLAITKVVAVEVLTGQPDVVVLRAEDGAPPLFRPGLAADPAFIWDDAIAVGYPQSDLREVEPGTWVPGIRGLAGTVTRKVEAGDELRVVGPAYEVSFAIPAGMSGGPVLSMRAGIPLGLIGVCLGNVSATSFLSGEEVEIRGEQRVIRQEKQMIEYGIVANLHRSAESRIALVDTSLAELIGFQTPTGFQAPTPETPQSV